MVYDFLLILAEDIFSSLFSLGDGKKTPKKQNKKTLKTCEHMCLIMHYHSTALLIDGPL